jgi:hypothetical protein
MLFTRRRFGPPLPLLWRVFLTNAAMLTAAALALAMTPATVSFPIALTEGLVLAGGLAATLGVDLLVLHRALGSTLSPPLVAPERDGRRRAYPIPTPRGSDRRAAASQRAGEAGTPGVGTRLLVCWTAPRHLADGDAREWTDAELKRVLTATGADHARVARLRTASPRHPWPCDWLLEVELATEADVRRCTESPLWPDLLADWRLLGMRPAAMVADTDRVVTGGLG